MSTRADRIARAKTARIEDVLGRRGVQLKRVGHELVGPCPVCGGTDRFSVHVGKQVWHCRGCNKGSDVIALVQHLDGSTFAVAIETLTGTAVASACERDRPSGSAGEREGGQRTNAARWLWAQRKPISEDTPPARYLRKRGYTGMIPPTLAYLPPRGEHGPAMIATFGLAPEVEPGVIVAPTSVTGVHLTRLTPDGDKADIEPVKITIGPSMGQPIVLAPPNDLLALAVTEGVEDGLSVYATGFGVWVAGTANRMPALAPAIPNWIECVTIYQHDDDAGRTYAPQLAEALTLRGVEVRIERGRS